MVLAGADSTSSHLPRWKSSFVGASQQPILLYQVPFGWLMGMLLVLSDFSMLGATGVTPVLQGAEANRAEASQTPVPADMYDSFVALQREDAGLHAIAAWGPDRIWVAGERGAILRTDDGGRNWRMQPTNITAPLYGICFQNESRGWAVGGTTHPYSHRSVGVVLTTTDGGEHWQLQSTPLLPQLRGIRMNQGRLIAWGEWSTALSSSLFESHDGGRTWGSLPNIPQALKTVHPIGNDLLLVCDDGQPLIWNMAASVGVPSAKAQGTSDQKEKWESIATTESAVIAVGRRGLIRQRSNSERWSSLELSMPEHLSKAFDFAAIAAYKNHIWITGEPSNVVFHSADGGKQWETQRLDSVVPMRQILFVDDQRGWGVGGAGVIMATRDGGKHWWPQRQPMARAGVLAIHQDPKSIPWQAIAYSTIELQKHAVMVHVRSSLATSSESNSLCASAINEAASLVGVSGFHSEYQDEVGAEDGPTLEIRLARLIRIARPDVVIVDAAQWSALSTVSSQASLQDQVLRAVEIAGSSNELTPDLEQVWGLPTWKVSKVFCKSTDGKSGLAFTPQQVLKSPGKLLFEVTQPAAMRTKRFDGQLEVDRLITLLSNVATSSPSASLFSGTVQTDDNSRRVSIKNAGNLQVVMGAATRQAMAEKLFDRTYVATGEDRAWEGQLVYLCQSLPKEELELALSQLATKLMQAGQWQRWQRVQEQMLRTDPTSGVSEIAWRELFQRGGSYEMNYWLMRQEEMKDRSQQYVATAELQLSDSSLASPFQVQPLYSRKDAQTDQNSVVTAGAAEQNGSTQLPEAPLMYWLMDQLETRHPAIQEDPEIALARTAWLRRAVDQSGRAERSTTALQLLSRQPALGVIAIAAEQEVSLLNRSVSPRSLSGMNAATQIIVYRTDAPPYLDGKLDEGMWKSNQGIGLTATQVGEMPATTVRFAYDDKWLYVSMQCESNQQKLPAPTPVTRTYDSNLDAEDRVRIQLDVDRDYATSYDLEVDRRGLTRDRCWGLASWNPKWVVGHSATSSQWTIEAAIAFEDLVSEPPVAGDVWSMALERTMPDGRKSFWANRSTSNAANIVPKAGKLIQFR